MNEPTRNWQKIICNNYIADKKLTYKYKQFKAQL